MKREFPGSLVQIHFHDRIGGVRRTMEAYARAFAVIAGDDAPNFLICRKCTGRDIGGSVTIDLPGADYHTFRTRQTYRTEVGRLAGRLRGLLTDTQLRFPVAVIGHNLNLGKNPALAAAFAQCARELGRTGEQYRFFSVLHDFAEAGRADLMASLRRLGLLDRTMMRDVYAAGAPVHYIFPDVNSATLTGLPAGSRTVLPHPVDAPVDNGSANEATIGTKLGKLARLDGLYFDPEKNLYCYPSRMIYRKNALEALLVATILTDGSLLTGSCGSSAADRERFAAMLQIARKYGLSLAIDPSRLLNVKDAKHSLRDPFTPFFPSVDAVISTSIAEGYGYSLVEPWAFGTPVIGRNPAGIDLPECLTPGLYSRLPVPVSWVSIAGCYEHYRRAYTVAFGRQYRSARSFAQWFVRDDTVDFGMLDTGEQAKIITRIMRSHADRGLVKSLTGCACAEQTVDRITTAAIRRVRSVLTRRSGRCFVASFVKCLLQRPLPVAGGWYRHPGGAYRRFDRFLPLVPPGRRNSRQST